MKPKFSKYSSDSNNFVDLVKVAIVITLVTILLTGTANLFSMFVARVFD